MEQNIKMRIPKQYEWFMTSKGRAVINYTYEGIKGGLKYGVLVEGKTHNFETVMTEKEILQEIRLSKIGKLLSD